MAQSIGAVIKARRLALGLTQEDLAARLHLTQANISRIEGNIKGPNAEMLLAIAEALDCDVHAILGIKDDSTPPKLEEDAKIFVTNTIRGDPQFGMYLRSFARNSDSLTDDDWKFLAATLKLAMGYAADVLDIKKVKGNI